MNILKTAKHEELFCAFALEPYLFQDDEFTVGDIEKEKLPDIYRNDKSYGIEVVRCEADSDFKQVGVCKYAYQNDYDYQKVKTWCEKRFPSMYNISEIDGKIGLLYGTGGAHKVDWMKENYEEQIIKKLNKLNNCNYSGITGDIGLCISIIHRHKDEYDAKLILFVYINIIERYNKYFDKVYVITSSSIFLFNPDNVKKITPIYNGDCIVDFEIIEKDYIKEIRYDYTNIIDRLRKNYDLNNDSIDLF